jgi:hypoxanthine phosphoribosyltransferase
LHLCLQTVWIKKNHPLFIFLLDISRFNRNFARRTIIKYSTMPDIWKLKDKNFERFILDVDIQAKVRELSERINTDLAGKKPMFIVVLNGAFIFASDLLKKVTIDCEIAFVKLSSYKGTQSSGVVQQIIGLDLDIKGRTIVIIEDIVDTGLTLDRFRETLNIMEPAEVLIATCLLKPEAFHDKFPIDYLCFSIPNEFVVGYGLDYDGLGRNSSDIYKIVEG